MTNYYLIKCKTISNNTLYFCHQVIYGEKQNVFIANINHALFYNEKEIDNAVFELKRNIKFIDIKSYTVENVGILPRNKKGKLFSSVL